MNTRNAQKTPNTPLKRISLTLAGCLLSTVAMANGTGEAHANLPLFMQTVDKHNTVSEGYVNPLNVGFDSSDPQNRQSAGRHHFEEPEIWVADVGTLLFNDTDHNGYFAGFSVSLDVDVSWDTADVYANFYLQPNGADANFLHATQVFTLYEQAISDRYRVDVDLLDNYPADDYNVIIDIVNASTGRVVDSVSHLTHRNLENLPLESADHQPHVPHHPIDEYEHGDVHHDHDDDHDYDHDLDFEVEYGFSATVTEYGGSTGYALLSSLAALIGLRLRRRTR